VGGQIGYDFDLNNGFVVGVEGDIEKTWETGSITDGTDFTKDTLNWTAALTGHAGYKLSDTFLPYVLAGIAFANNTIEDAFTREGSFDGISTNTHVGYTVGAGLQAALTQSISGFVEGRYSDYGIKLYGAESANDNSAQDGPVALSDWTVRAGFNFKFH
jgi:outer membrane immunogenic protein